MRNENPLAELPDTGHQGQKSAEPISELNSDVMDEERASLLHVKQAGVREIELSGYRESES